MKTNKEVITMINWNIQLILGILYLMFDGVVLGLTWLVLIIKDYMRKEEVT